MSEKTQTFSAGSPDDPERRQRLIRCCELFLRFCFLECFFLPAGSGALREQHSKDHDVQLGLFITSQRKQVCDSTGEQEALPSVQELKNSLLPPSVRLSWFLSGSSLDYVSQCLRISVNILRSNGSLQSFQSRLESTVV